MPVRAPASPSGSGSMNALYSQKNAAQSRARSVTTLRIGPPTTACPRWCAERAAFAHSGVTRQWSSMTATNGAAAAKIPAARSSGTVCCSSNVSSFTEGQPSARRRLVSSSVEGMPGLPMLHGTRGVRVVYNTVGTAESLEVAVRIGGPRSTVVMSGVDTPARFEWSPHYFKEINLVGSNAFGVEEWNGKRQHASRRKKNMLLHPSLPLCESGAPHRQMRDKMKSAASGQRQRAALVPEKIKAILRLRPYRKGQNGISSSMTSRMEPPPPAIAG